MKRGVYVGCFPAGMALKDRFALAAEAGFDAIEVRGLVRSWSSSPVGPRLEGA